MSVASRPRVPAPPSAGLMATVLETREGRYNTELAPPSRRTTSTMDFLINHLGYLGIIGFLALCGLGIPIPEEIPLVAAGVLSSHGTFDPLIAFGACLLGAILGDSLMYGMGRYFGHAWLTKHPRFSRFIDAEKEEKFEHTVKKHGFKVLLLTRFLVGVRGPVYYAAGAAKVPFPRFLLWDGFSATLVVGIVFGLAYKFGHGIGKLIHEAEVALTVFVLGLAAVGIFFLYRHHTQRMAAALEDIAEHDNEDAAKASE